MRARRTATLIMTALCLIAAGCTGSTSDNAEPAFESLDAYRIYARALDNVAMQPSFRLTESFDPARGGRLEVTGAGTSRLVTVELDGERGEIRKDGTDVFAKGSQGFFSFAFGPNLSDELFAVAGSDRWLHLRTTDPRFGGVKRLFDPELLLHLLTPLTKEDRQEHDGQPTITLRDAVGTVLVIALTANPLPMRYIDDRRQGQFSYGEPLTVSAPDPSEIVPAPHAVG